MTFSVKFYDARDITPRAAKNIIECSTFFFLQKNFITNTVNVVRREIIMILGPLKIDDLLGKNVLNICQAWRSLWQKVLVVVSVHIIGLLRKTEEKQGLGKENTDSFLKNMAELIWWYTDWGWVNFPISNYHYSRMKEPKVSFWPWGDLLGPHWCIKVIFTSLIGT